MAQPVLPLYRILYRSCQTLEVAQNLDFEVDQIIEKAMTRNRAVGLTGLLLVIRGHFIQALEGQVDEVRTTYARISRDPRHRDLHIITQGPTADRLFGDWSMCASSLAPSDKAILNVLNGKDDFKPRALTPTSALRLLTTVAEIRRRAVVETLAS